MLRHGKSEMDGFSKNIHKVPKLNSANDATINTTSPSGSALDALPKQFVLSMKKLFDILDDRHCGYVKFSDIEKGWQDDGCKGLPCGVIDSLRKVTPASGLLSFERFCAGLKICLLRNQTESTDKGLITTAKPLPLKPQRPPSAPLLEIENPLPNTPWNTVTNNQTASVCLPHIASNQRTLSLPQLSPDSDACMELDMDVSGVVPRVTTYGSPPPPPKPPRSSNVKSSVAGVNLNKVADKQEIRNALQNWQMGVLLNEMDSTKDTAWKQPFPPYRGCADGGSTSTNDSAATSYVKKSSTSSSKRREPRRHTLQNGIDYNMLKRLKQIEEERAVLLLGLNAVEKARDWYLQQLVCVEDKLQYLGRMGGTQAQWSEVQQEHLNFQRARVLEVNRNLAALADTWERAGFPMHFNLALNGTSAHRHGNVSGAGSVGGGGGLLQPVDHLRQQNRHLADEVNLKSDRIALLEGEKQALMRELFLLQQRTPVGVTGRVNGGLMGVLSQASPACSSSSGGLGDADVVY